MISVRAIRERSMGALISHEGDLLITGTDACVAYLSGRLGDAYGLQVFEGNEAIDLGMGIKNVPNEIIEDGNISDGAKTFTVDSSSSSN